MVPDVNGVVVQLCLHLTVELVPDVNGVVVQLCLHLTVELVDEVSQAVHHGPDQLGPSSACRHSQEAAPSTRVVHGSLGIHRNVTGATGYTGRSTKDNLAGTCH